MSEENVSFEECLEKLVKDAEKKKSFLITLLTRAVNLAEIADYFAIMAQSLSPTTGLSREYF